MRLLLSKVLANSTKICYNYDDLSRVTSRTIKNLADDSVISTETFSYDAAGNITDGSANTTFVYDTNNRLTSFNGQNVSYDCDGNMTFGNGIECGYDSQNRLLYAGEHDYFYNAENVRIRNLCTDEDTSYVYDTNCKLSRLLVKTTNGVTTKYVYGLGLIGEEVNNTFKTYHFDSRGSTVAITDANGNITDTFAYDTYGKRTVLSGTSDIIFGYNGRDGVVTDKNGLIYMRARYYSPEMRRFINADIIAGNINNAVTLNRYAYANANPVMNIDPLGLSCPSCMSGEIDSCSCRSSNTNVKTNSRPSTNNFGNEDRNGQVLNKDKYVQDLINKYNGKNSVSKTPTAQAEPEEQQERDYEAEAIERKHNTVENWEKEIACWFNENALNHDGSYSLYDNDRFGNKNTFHEQLFVFTPSPFTWNWQEKKLGGSLSFDLVTGGWEEEYFNLSLLDFGHAEVGAEIKDGKVKFGALASIWSPSLTIKFGDVTLEIGAEVGAVGAGFNKIDNGFSIYGSYNWIGASINLTW